MTHLAIPNLGNYTIALKTAVRALGIEPWASTSTSRTAMTLGCAAAPESACVPFKAHIGHFIEAANNGVEYAMMVNSVGTCRLRYYRALCEKIIAERDLPMRVFGLGNDGFKPPMIRYFDPPLFFFIKHVRHALKKMHVIDEIELTAWRLRAKELQRGSTTGVMNQCFADLDAAQTPDETQAVSDSLAARFGSIEIDEGRDVIRVGLIGEVSVLRDRTLNQDVEEVLGNLGVDVRNFFLLGAELGNIFKLGFGEKKNTRKQLMKIAEPYLGIPIGGHALDSVAHTIRCAEEEYDAMIHLCPSGCMPEVSARPIMRRVSEDKDIPVLMMSFDEHTSAVGVATRLEAFVDLLRDRRDKATRGLLPPPPKTSALRVIN